MTDADDIQIAKSPFINMWLRLKPYGLDALLEWTAPQGIKSYYQFVEKSVADRTKLEEKFQEEGSNDKHIRKDIFHYLFQSKDPDTGKPAYSFGELFAEAQLFIIAGSDTTALTLSALFFYLARNPHAYSRLTAEIRTKFQSVSDIRWGPNLISCDYLQGCLNETLRMSPPVASELPREVLAGGFTVDGFSYPKGTIIGVSSWSLNRNEQYFPDCNTFRPERWIVDEKEGFTAEQVMRAHSAFFPFSAGPYACMGKNLAWRELTVVTGRLLYRMDMRLPHGIDVGGGSPELGWGRADKNQFLLRDAYVSLRDGPFLQFKPAGEKKK